MADAADVSVAAAAASIEEEVFTEREHEVAAILCDLSGIVLARSPPRRRRRGGERAEIPSWGCRRPRSMPEEKPAAPVPDNDEAASPDTPLVFIDESGGDDADEPAAATTAASAADKKARPHAEWVQQQRRVVASLSLENAQLSKQIGEYRARLQSSRNTNDDLKHMQDKLKRKREQQEVEELKRRLQVEPTVAQARVINRPAPVPVPGLDLNEPALASLTEEDDEAIARAKVAAAGWRLWDQQRVAMANKAAMTAEARLRRREIRRAKASANRIRR